MTKLARIMSFSKKISTKRIIVMRKLLQIPRSIAVGAIGIALFIGLAFLLTVNASASGRYSFLTSLASVFDVGEVRSDSVAGSESPALLSSTLGGCSENFDSVTAPSLPAGWSSTTSPTFPFPWVTSTTSPDTAPNDAFAQDPSAATNTELISPPIAVSPAGASFSFRINYDTQSGADGMVLEIGINGPPFQDIVAAGGSFSAGGYNGTIGPTNPNIGGRMAWTGNSGGYITTTVNLPNAANGQNVQLKWRMGTDGSIAGNGVRIDTITSLPCAAGTATATNTPTPTPTSAPVDLIGLTSTGALVTFNSNSPGTTTSPVAVTGLVAGDTLVGIDIRPADSQLIGLGYNSSSGNAHVYAINPTTGAATSVNANSLFILNGLTRVTMEFDPTANTIRVVTNGFFGGGNNNYRIQTGGTGTLLSDTSLSPSNEGIKGTAHSRNNAGGGTSGATTLYDIDGTNNRLVTQGSIDYFTGSGTSPNTGTLTTVANLIGVTGSTVVGFDIYNAPGTAAASPGTAFVATGTTLYSLNLVSAAAVSLGTIGSGLTIRDIAAGMPALPTPTATSTATNTPSNTATATSTSTPTNTPTPTPTICGNPGALDGSFGVPVITSFGSGDDYARSVAVQADGKIVAAGFGFSSLSANDDFAVTRYYADGVLDLTFGGTGKVFTPIGSFYDRAYSTAIQADGRIVVAGYSQSGSSDDFAVVRYNSDGTLDLSFDGDGKVTTDFGGTNDYAYTVAIQADGKIVAAGTSSQATGDIAIVRYNPNGTLDSSFGVNGKVITDLGGGESANSVAIQSDGKLVAAGTRSDVLAVARYNQNGTLDTTFNGTGWVVTPIGSGASEARSVAIQTNGAILAAGYGITGVFTGTGFALVRYNTDGSLDTSFNGTGKVLTTIGSGNDQVYSVVIQSDGRIIAGGYGQNPNEDFALAKYNTNGTLDTTFNGTGTVVTPIGSSAEHAYSVAVQTDGRIVAAGDSYNGSNFDFALLRYNADGTLNAFGTGKVVTSIGSGYDQIQSTAIQTDGKVVAAGFSNNGSTDDFAVVRYNGNGTLDTTFNGTGKVITPIGTGSDGVSEVAIQPDGKILAAGSAARGAESDFALARYNTDGSLDTTLNGTGKVVTTVGAGTSYAASLAIQSDGKVVAAGSGSDGIHNTLSFALVRYNQNGTLDTSFNGTGTLVTYVGPFAGATSVAIQSDGKIVVAGTTNGDFTIVRYSASGALDPTFNGTGIVHTQLQTTAGGRAESVALQNDGRIVVAGWVQDNTGFHSGLVRYNPVGTLDTTFNGTGSVVDPATGFFHSAAIQSDGRIVAAGERWNGSNDDFILGRYNTNGTPDTTFNGTGSVITPIGTGNDYANSVSVQTNGRIIVGGYSDNASNDDFALVGYYQNSCPVGPTPTATATSTPTSTATNTATPTPTGSPSASISGTITYGNAIGNPLPPRFVKNVSVASTGGAPAVGPVITGTPGTYTLTGFGAGSYTIRPTKPGGVNGAITSNDAARVAQGVSGSVPFVSQNQRFVADSSGNGTVSSNDAALIARFAAGLTGTGNVGQWKFFVTGAPSPLPTAPQTYNDSRTYPSVTSNLTGEDYVALLVGEASGNWNPATHPRPAVSRRTSDIGEDSGDAVKPITISAQPVTAASDKETVVPVSVVGVAGKDVISYEFDLRYDPFVVQPLEDPVDVSGTVSRGLMVVTNPIEPGILRVVVYGPMAIDEDGVLLNLRFTAVGAVGSVSPLTFERVMFNEGESPVRVADGQIGLS